MQSNYSPPIRRALLSVSDKTGLVEFARGLVAAGVELLSTGGTRQALAAAGISVRDVAEYTGFPEMLDGRVKTLHPKIHAGILYRHDRPDDVQALAEHDIGSIELVVVNLYPFARTVARPNVARDEAIENIDIGGPSLVRGAAKNHAFTAIVTDPSQYNDVLAQVRDHGGTTFDLRFRLAAAAYAHTAQYDAAIAAYFAKELAASSATDADAFPPVWQGAFSRVQSLRYGENPHQRAAFYAEVGAVGQNLAAGKQLHGKELSYNNLLDLDSALAIVRSLPGPAATVIKHNNPCGAAEAGTLAEATARALAGDPVSAFGGVLGFNRPVDAASADLLAAPGNFIEAIVAPEFAPAAIEILTTRPKWKANVRLVAVGALGVEAPRLDLRRLNGGLLLQDADVLADPEDEWKVVTSRQPTEREMHDLRFAWALARYVKSNAIVLVNDRALCGVGAGQMSRVDSMEIAIRKAGERARGCVVGSDAFFPFADSVVAAAAAGAVAVIQPGGSRNDPEVIAACDERDLAMVFTGRRHFRH